MLKKIAVLVFITVIGVVGCSNPPQQGASIDDAAKQKLWQQRMQALSSVKSWRLSGRASVAYRNENYPFGLDWQQQNVNSHQLLIRHPVTQKQLAKLVTLNQSVTLTTDTGKVLRDTSAERLIEQQMRVKMPVDGMQTWVRGIAAPQYPLTRLALDNSGRPISIEQAGWTIQYGAYQSVSLMALPTSITISRTQPESIRVKVRVKSW